MQQLKNNKIKLVLIEEIFAVAQLEKSSSFPDWLINAELWSITKTNDEISIVCPQDLVPTEVKSEKDWCCVSLRLKCWNKRKKGDKEKQESER